MQMSLEDVLAFAKTPEQHQEMKQRLVAMMFHDKDDDEIDFSEHTRSNGLFTLQARKTTS